MMKKPPDHPELGSERNPLLEALAPFVPLQKLPALLKNEPLKDGRWRTLPPGHRESLLYLIDDHYWPVEQHLEAANDIQLMLRSGLIARNPLSPKESVRINRLALSEDAKDVVLQSLRVRAGGGLVMALTGMGKSTLVDRALSVFAPTQVITHSRSEVCGWSVMRQVTHLVIDAPSNATRVGLLGAIAGGLDALLYTDYATDVRKQKNIDNAVIFVIKILSFHRVGLVVIDENQKSTLDDNPWRRHYVLFFLALMNLGVPVLLLGHPDAFLKLRQSAQLMRRFTAAGLHEFRAATDLKETWWDKRFGPGEIKFSPCESIPSWAEVNEATFPNARGTPGLFSALWKEANRIALRRSDDTAVLTVDDLASATQSPRFMELAKIAKAIAEGNARGDYVDLPVRTSKDETTDAGGTNAASGQGVTADETLAEAKRMGAYLKGKNTRIDKKATKDRELNEKLAEDDLRRTSNSLALLSGISAAEQAELEY